MKLNNKGFAITSVLYGLLILFVILVGSYLTILVAKKNRLDTVSEEINERYGFNKEKTVSITSFPYTTDFIGKYVFKIVSEKEYTCSTYLNEEKQITYENDNLNVTFNEDVCNERNDDNNILKAEITKIYYNGDETNE